MRQVKYLIAVVFSVSNCSRGRKSVSAEAACLLLRAQGETSTDDRRRAAEPDFIVPAIRLEKGSRGRQTRHPHRLASQRVQAVLALEVSPRQASATFGDPRIDCTHGA